MGVCVLGLHSKVETTKEPQVMDRAENREDNGHVIDITTEPSSSTSTQDRQVNRSNSHQTENLPSTSVTDPVFQTPLPTTNPTNANTNTRTTPVARRTNGTNVRRRSPLNSGYWISFELVITVSQIIAAIVVLSISRHEHPRAPLFTWVIGYASGCVATLPLLFWRFYYRNDTSDQNPAQPRQNSSPSFLSAMATSLTSSNPRNSVNNSTQTTTPVRVLLNARLKVLVEYFKMGLDCFFAVWFVVGNVWIFGGHSSVSDAPNLYRLCLVFLAFSCIGYAMPFILCATICCCLPCIISVLGFREDLSQNRGATSESINSLPTYKFKIKKHKHGSNRGSHESTIEGGVVAAGTENECVLSGEDAVCCICLAKYANNDELRQLMCSHFFHKECVDKWLKINASCPLCKSEVGESALSSLMESTGVVCNYSMEV